MKGVANYRNSGGSRGANESSADETLVGQLLIRAIQESDAYMQAMHQVKAAVVAFRAELLADARRSIASIASSVRQLLALLPPRNPMVEAAFDAWKALPKGDPDPIDRFLSEHLKLHITPECRKL
jgi:hypothetical protein